MTKLWGLAGNNKLFGDNGKDSLFGKAGIDQSTGGLGADRFVFRAISEAAPDGPVYEEILDFNRAEGDKIDLRGIDADADRPGVGRSNSSATPPHRPRPAPRRDL